MKKLLPLFLAALVELASCAKKGEADPLPAPAPSRAELLTANPWQLTAQREVITPQSGGAAVTRTSTVAPGTTKVIYRTDGTILLSHPSQQGNPTTGGSYTLVDSVLWSNISGSIGIVRELTANRLVLVDHWQGPNETTHHTDTFTH